MRSILTPFIGFPPGPPRGPRTGETPGNFRGGKIRGRAGPPGPPGPRAPGAQKWAIPGHIYCISYYSGGFPGGALLAPPGPPGGQKSAHFFGYLITLPVGTVWATFFHPPFWDNLGQFGIMPIWTVFIACIECGLQIGLVLITSIECIIDCIAHA